MPGKRGYRKLDASTGLENPPTDNLRVRKISAYDSGMVVSGRTRWLALAAGTFHAIFGLPLISVMSLLLCLPIIIGALISNLSSVRRKYLLWFGAGAISIVALPIDVGILLLALQGGTDPRVTAAVVVSLLLVFSCDAALVADVAKQRRLADSRTTSA